jgi:hypothetical protein
MFDRDVFFNEVRASLFAGHFTQQQVDGMNHTLDVWEWIPSKFPDVKLDLRWLGYMMATDYHETSQHMWPIEEYGKGEGMPYGQIDPETLQIYYGRGRVQLTWRDNYHRAVVELDLTGDEDIEWNADMALDPVIASKVQFKGMYQGWFRTGETLPKYFDDDTDDAYTAREIINGDKSHVPSWSNGVSIGNLIKGYHNKFLAALDEAWSEDPAPTPVPPEKLVVGVDIEAPEGVEIRVQINGEPTS